MHAAFNNLVVLCLCNSNVCTMDLPIRHISPCEVIRLRQASLPSTSPCDRPRDDVLILWSVTVIRRLQARGITVMSTA